MKTVIIGLGNPILSDDGVGPRVAAVLEERLKGQDLTVRETSLGGLSLVDLLAGYDRAIIIDAIQTVNGKPGEIYHLDAKDFDHTRHASSPHDLNFATALKFASQMGMVIPQQIDIFAVEAVDVTNFSETCTPEVERAIPVCVELVLEELGKSSGE
ncbi:MAG: hydrogenase maturation protease [Dehalococcoidia bacterium]|nr:hydrogenase maturation protease [Dehalococcoidia bacterium]